MTAVAFDTHFFIKKLVAQGMPETQAEVVVDIVRATKELDFNAVATKNDIHLLKNDIHELEVKLIKWIISLLLLQAGLIVAIMKLS